MTKSYLDVSIFPGEEGNHRQTENNAALEYEQGAPHEPIERGHAGRAVLAGLAALGARQTLKHSRQVVLALLALKHK